MESKNTTIEMPLTTITQEEGVALARKAFKRVQVSDFKTSLLDRITDPIRKYSYKPDANPDDPGRRRLHPILVSGFVCFGLILAVFLYFSFWR
jgi:hypothetical protein